MLGNEIDEYDVNSRRPGACLPADIKPASTRFKTKMLWVAHAPVCPNITHNVCQQTRASARHGKDLRELPLTCVMAGFISVISRLPSSRERHFYNLKKLLEPLALGLPKYYNSLNSNINYHIGSGCKCLYYPCN